MDDQMDVQAATDTKPWQPLHQFPNDSQRTEILDFLGCPVHKPTLRYLNRLIHAYLRRVPWESVSRIVKRHATASVLDCPRWPQEFWGDAIRQGFGGTCYESSLAFFNLLMSLGYEGYLTVNDMGGSRGCHASMVLLLSGRKYLVDITIPVHCAIRLDPRKTTRRRTSFHDFSIRPVRENVYEVDRSHHSQKNAFTLIDLPVSLPDFHIILERDYLDTGFFLKSVVMVKVIDDQAWRFFSDRKPYQLECFNRKGKTDNFLQPETMAHVLAGKFHMPQAHIEAALSLIPESPIPHPTIQALYPLPQATHDEGKIS